MNCPSRTEEPVGQGYNQNPSALSAELTTREDMNGIANARILRRIESSEVENVAERDPDDDVSAKRQTKVMAQVAKASHVGESSGMSSTFNVLEGSGSAGGPGNGGGRNVSTRWFDKVRNFFMTFGKFVGPGFMVCVSQHERMLQIADDCTRYRSPTSILVIMQQMLRLVQHIASSYSLLC